LSLRDPHELSHGCLAPVRKIMKARVKKYTILIVDDDSFEREMVKKKLSLSKRGDYSFIEASTVEEGLELYFSNKIDCILLDYSLPGKNGFYMIKRLTNKLTNSLPTIVVLTGQGDEKIAATFIQLGAMDYLKKDDLNLELLENSILTSIKKQKKNAKIKQNELMNDYYALHDPLTDLFNRRELYHAIDTAINSAKRYNHLAAILLCDLNKFKLVNDTYGHKIGDLLLKLSAERFKQIIRKTDVIIRLGGDEFLLVLNQIAQVNDADLLAERLCHMFEKPFLIENNTICIGISIGIIAISPLTTDSPEALVNKADVAMYHIKKTSKSGYYRKT
jgi:diguanylate cyclase (GGDEF)-like protein